MMTFPIYGKIKHVPNHQPDWIEYDSTCSSCLLLVNKKPWIFYLKSPNKWRSPVEFPLELETSKEDRQFKSCRVPPNTATNNLLNFFLGDIYIYISITIHFASPSQPNMKANLPSYVKRHTTIYIILYKKTKHSIIYI